MKEPTIKKITFIFQIEPFLLLTGYLEFHFRNQGKSGKSQGIPSWKKSGNLVHINQIIWLFDLEVVALGLLTQMMAARLPSFKNIPQFPDKLTIFIDFPN